MIDTVKHVPRERGRHHGDLRRQLLIAGTEIVSETGPDTFSLREAARRAGVSPAAPAHHFGDVRGLLTAIAAEGFVQLGDRLEAVKKGSAQPRVLQFCHAYVDFARECPGQFRLMWRKNLLDVDDPAHVEAGRRAYHLLDEAVRGSNAASAPFDALASAPTIALWSTIHGFASMVIDDAFFVRSNSDDDSISVLLDAILKETGNG